MERSLERDDCMRRITICYCFMSVGISHSASLQVPSTLMKINLKLQPTDLTAKLRRFWQLSAGKIQQIEKSYDSSKGSPVFHRARKVHQSGMDGMDARFSIRIGHPPIRRHRRAKVSRSGANGDRGTNGAARQPFWSPRPRLQQRQHLRKSLAVDGRRTHSRKPVGTRLLRTGPQTKRCGAGAAMDKNSKTAASFIRSMGHNRCLSIPSAPCARWPSRTTWVTC